MRHVPPLATSCLLCGAYTFLDYIVKERLTYSVPVWVSTCHEVHMLHLLSDEVLGVCAIPGQCLTVEKSREQEVISTTLESKDCSIYTRH